MVETISAALPRIIAFTGPKSCGKDTMAQVLIRQNTGRQTTVPFFARTPFAQGPKQICHDVFGWSWEDMDDFDFKETPLLEWPNTEPRWPMMDIANWMRDKYGGHVWVKTLARRINRMHYSEERHGAYVITDLRFPEEVAWLKSMGKNALIIYVYRDEAEEKLKAAQEAGDAKALNASEAHYAMLYKEADFIVTNNEAPYKAQHEIMNIIANHFGSWFFWKDMQYDPAAL